MNLENNAGDMSTLVLLMLKDQGIERSSPCSSRQGTC